MEQDEIINEFILGLKSNNIRYEWMAKFYPAINEKIKNKSSLKDIFIALNEKQMIDKNFSFSSFRKYFYEVKTSTEPKQNNKQTKSKNKTKHKKENNKTEAITENNIQTTTEQNNNKIQQDSWNKLVMIKNNLNINKCYQTQEQKDKAGRIYNNAMAGNRDFADKVKTEFEQILNYPVAKAGTNNES